MGDGQEGRLEFLLETLKDAAAVKATTTATRNKNKFNIPMVFRMMATAGANCRNPVLEKDLRKNDEG